MQSLWAQKKEWTSPHVGYSNTSMLSVDKVEFTPHKTVMHVTVSGREGEAFWIESTSCLKANGKKYALLEVPEVGTDKKNTVPKSGEVHFTMQFAPLPSNTKVMHFVERDGDEGWHLCNIRDGKRNFATALPKEWRNVEYADLKELPESKLCDDSTTIRVKILNYVPEAGVKLDVYEFPFDFDQRNYISSFPISANGTAAFKLHPCFPITMYVRVGKGEFFPLLVMPGDECEILLDMERGGTPLAFKGDLAKVNYELNVLGAKDFISFDFSEAHFDSLLAMNKKMKTLLEKELTNESDRIFKSQYCYATKEWLEMTADYLYIQWVDDYNQYIARKVEKELKDAHSSILDNSDLWNNVRQGLSVPLNTLHYRFFHRNKITYLVEYMDAMRFFQYGLDGARCNVHPYIKDIWTLSRALTYNEQESYKEGLKKAEKIADPELKAFYPVAAQRWQAFVDSINRIPHLHFDQHERTLTSEQLKEEVLREYRGKNVVFLVYARETEENVQDLQELDPIIAETDSQKTVFIHIDINFMGVRGWLQSALRWHGEHYGGRRQRYGYGSMFYKTQYPASGIYYELHSPDGATILSTTDKKEALQVIEAWNKEPSTRHSQ